eukprot:TRINITY_DN1804_c0_g1_i3.p1 TRINITY_DN1804_c0_g1~~TRINITY_DN1804_c0_g1_i3.p1  ORF type:complete len:1374 (+),score=310.77 TRINITY_DN1804_c0_g1_i3:73-4194(+)
MMADPKSKIRGILQKISTKRDGFSDFQPPTPVNDEESQLLVADRLYGGVVMYSLNFQIRVKGGTIDSILQRLMHKTTAEEDIEIFLFGYRPWISSQELLERLFCLFFLDPSEGLSDSELTEFNEGLKLTRKRVIGFLKTWLEKFYSDFEKHRFLGQRLEFLLKKTYLTEKDYSSIGKELLDEFKARESDKKMGKILYKYYPDTAPPSFQPPSSNWIDFEPEEIARQLTVCMQHSLCVIEDHEFMGHVWYKAPHNCPNLLKFLRFCQSLSDWCASEILSPPDVRDRFKVIKKFCEIAAKCNEIKNFTACHQIFSGLFDPYVWRMRGLWSKLEKDKRFWEVYNEIRGQLDQPSKYSAYRKLLPDKEGVPFVPSIGILLWDLMQIDVNDPDYLIVDENRTDVLNFQKLSKQIKIIKSTISLAKQTLHNFNPVDQIFNFFMGGLPVLDTSRRSNLSTTYEPKDSDLPEDTVTAICPFPLNGPDEKEKKKLRDLIDKVKGSESDEQKNEKFTWTSNYGFLTSTSSGISSVNIISNPSSLKSSIPSDKVYTLNSSGCVIEEGELIGGNIRHLLLGLLGQELQKTSPKRVSEDFEAFFDTYRNYINPDEILDIFESFWKSADSTKKERIGYAIVNWLKFHFFDFSSNPEVLKKLRAFLNSTIYTDPNTDYAQEITNQIKSNVVRLKESANTSTLPTDDDSSEESSDEERKEKNQEQEKKGVLTSSKSKTCSHFDDRMDFLGFETNQLAKQITLYEHMLIKSIDPTEFVSKDQSPHLNKFLKFSRAITSHVIRDIIASEIDKILQYEILRKYVKLSIILFGLNNFNAFCEIAAGLLNPNITSMQSLWQSFVQKDYDLYTEFQTTFQNHFNTSKNYKPYQTLVDDTDKPFIPYIANYISNIAVASPIEFLNVSDSNDSSPAVNFRRLKNQHVIVRKIASELEKMKKYNFVPVPSILHFLKDHFEEVPIPKSTLTTTTSSPPSRPRKNSVAVVETNQNNKESSPKKTEQTDSVDEPPTDDKQTPAATVQYNWDDFPKAAKKKCLKFLEENEMKDNVNIIWAVCEFLIPEDMPSRPRQKSPPYAPKEVMEEAEKELIVPKKPVKKLYKKMVMKGQGGFASVFSAKDLSNNENVAIKKLKHDTSRSKEANVCEIGFLKLCLGIENIVQYQKTWHFPEDQEVWMVMEFMHGGTLQYAARTNRFSDKHIAYVAREMCKALKFLHSKKCAHRDLKSQNVMLSISGAVKLIDFGLCADFSNGPRTTIVGSPFWIPPEMIKREPHSYPVDIWSMGVCLLELYLMSPPHSLSGIKCMFTAATKGLADQIPKNATKEARRFLEKCLVMDPSKRASAEELLQEPFVMRNDLSSGITEVLRDIFLSDTLDSLGF